MYTYTIECSGMPFRYIGTFQLLFLISHHYNISILLLLHISSCIFLHWWTFSSLFSINISTSSSASVPCAPHSIYSAWHWPTGQAGTTPSTRVAGRRCSFRRLQSLNGLPTSQAHFTMGCSHTHRQVENCNC